MDIKTKIKKNLSNYSKVLLAVTGISAVSLVTKTEAMMTKPGTLSRVISTASVSKTSTPPGNFKATYQKLQLPNGGEVENTGLKSVSFTNTDGQKIVYSEAQSVKLKLLLPDSMLVREKYINERGEERIYLGVKGAGGVQDPVTPVTTTTIKPKEHKTPRKSSRLPKPGLSTIQEEDKK